MNKTLLATLVAALPLAAIAQTAVDAMSISQSDLRGTARFMSMGGAFTALGGDMSTLNQNPAGIGIYRSSEITLSGDLDIMSAKSEADGFSNTTNRTRFSCNNFGYIGAVRLASETMPFFNWGASYSRVASFNRNYSGRLTDNLQTSYTNLVADYTTADGWSNSDLAEGSGYNPFYDSYAPWSSILVYNAYGINPTAPGASSYAGLYNYDSTAPGYAQYLINEKGYIDEYAINFGGNLFNTVYWGIGFGITDLDFKQTAYYEEGFNSGANVPDTDAASYTDGSASYGITNHKHIWGSGFNMKFGLIFKPINEFRIGLAVHTPTWYNLSYEGIATMGYDYDSSNYPQGEYYSGSYTTDYDDFDWDFKSPWRIMVGAAGVIGGKGIISAEYEYRGVNDMVIKDQYGNKWPNETEDVKCYYQATNILRLGAEYRVTPAFSIRAGYSYESSPVKKELLDPTGNQATYVYTSGPDDTETQPAYTLNRDTQYITCGLGYRINAFSIDLAYVHRNRKSDYHAFTDYNENETGYLVTAPKAKITDNNNSLVLTLSYRF
ncbi:MAG: outer membrane protein transport protein [Muribaculaceae bacterium]|nr:outer membrane protein transport protein [Muribaculaceae bacterium]